MSISAFVGRREAWRALDAALERALRFEAPQFVTIVGGPGMGKSRLLAEWLRDVTTRGRFRTVEAAALRSPTGRPTFVGSATGPDARSLVSAWLRDRFGLDEGLDGDTALAMLRAQLQVVFGDRRVSEVAAFLAPFLGLEVQRGPLAQTLAERPGSSEDITRAVFARFLEEDARTLPLLVVLEDVHAADDTSLDLLNALGRELGTAPVVIVFSARPELRARRPEWGRQGGSHAFVELGPLSVHEAGALAVSLADPAVLGAKGLAPLLEAACGCPGQIVSLIAAACRGEAPTMVLPDGAHHPPPAAVPCAPSSDEDAARRIGGLSMAERELLGRAAAFGSLFWTGGVIALGRLGAEPPDPTVVFAPDPEVEAVHTLLEGLEARGFVLHLPEPTIAGESEWSFCHAAERALLAAMVDPELMRRRRLFAAQWLEGRFGVEDLAERFELLGNLFEGGGDARRAGECFVAAGDRANREGRFEQARSLYLRGVRLLGLDDSVFKMDALHKLGEVAARSGRTREALAHFAELLRLAWRLDLPGKGGAAHCRIGRLHRGLGNYRVAVRHFEHALALFELVSDRPGIAACLDDIGRVEMLLGNIERAMQRHRAALKLREELGDDRGRALTISWLGLCEVQLGELLRAERCFKAALELSRRCEDAHGIAFALMDLAGLERELGRPDRAYLLLQEIRALVRDLAEPLSEAHLAIQIGESLLQLGRPREAEQELSAARELAQRFGTRRLQAQVLRALAEVKLRLSDPAAARALAEDSLSIAQQIGVPALIGAALRVMASAEAAGAPGDVSRGGARELFDRALEALTDGGAELELGRTLAEYAAFEAKIGRDEAAEDLRLQAAGIHARAWNDADVGLFDRL